MRTDAVALNRHYGQSRLAQRILAALDGAGADTSRLNRDDLAPIDELHIGGRPATRELARLAGLQPGERVLDIGSGLGGPARTLAAEFVCEVTGIDVTGEYVRAARLLTERAGLAGLARFQFGDALDLPFEAESFDAVTLIHVGVNVADKQRLFGEARRVLRPGGRVALLELCAGAASPPRYPVFWARDASLSFLVRPEELARVYAAAGLRSLLWQDVTPHALEWVEGMAAPPPTGQRARPGIEVIAGEHFPELAANAITNLREDRLRVVRAVLERRRKKGEECAEARGQR